MTDTNAEATENATAKEIYSELPGRYQLIADNLAILVSVFPVSTDARLLMLAQWSRVTELNLIGAYPQFDRATPHAVVSGIAVAAAERLGKITGDRVSPERSANDGIIYPEHTEQCQDIASSLALLVSILPIAAKARHAALIEWARASESRLASARPDIDSKTIRDSVLGIAAVAINELEKIAVGGGMRGHA